MTQSYDELVKEAQARVSEILPWDLQALLQAPHNLLLVDVREPLEFFKCHIAHSINVPRGVLEQSCEWDYDETVPQLVKGRAREIIVICRSGKRSVLAAEVMLKMGFSQAISLKLGVRGWNDAEFSLQDAQGKLLNPDEVDVLLASHLQANQRRP